MFVPTRVKSSANRLWWRFMVLRQKGVNRVLSALYGSAMQVLPAGHVGLAGAIVLWTVQDGGRQIVMLRNPDAKDSRARLVSFMGLGKSGDMATAMKAAMRTQLGEAMAKTLSLNKITLDRVAAAPMFTYTDEENGIVTPVQVLVWVQQLQPVQLELVQTLADAELVLVPEHMLATGKVAGVSGTHVALWRSVARHLPLKILPREDDADAREERLAAAEKATAPGRLH